MYSFLAVLFLSVACRAFSFRSTLPLPSHRHYSPNFRFTVKADYDVIFKDGPLGFTLHTKSPEASFATVKTVAAGGQAAQGGVTVNDIIVANDMGAKNTAEVITTMNTKPRPLKIPFRRSKRPTPGFSI